MNSTQFDAKRKREFEYFLSELQKLGDQGLRPHQAYSVINARANEGCPVDADKFYWEGVYEMDFSAPEDFEGGDK